MSLSIQDIDGKWFVCVDGVTYLIVALDGDKLVITDNPDPWADEIWLPVTALPALQLVLQKIAEKAASA